MRNVFILVGAGSGNDIDGFRRLSANNINHEIFAFEPTPNRAEQLRKYYPEVTVIEAAASVLNGTTTLYVCNDSDGNSITKNKTLVAPRYRRTGSTISVNTIDICEWILENFTKDDHITMVLDIEGSEYEVITKMTYMGLLGWIDELYVEFHGRKLKCFDIQFEKNMIQMLIDKFGDNVYIDKYYQPEAFKLLNSEYRDKMTKAII